jgi:N utilization substance protein B
MLKPSLPTVATKSSEPLSLIQQHQQARVLALQALFEIDSVKHQPGAVIDERLRARDPGVEGTRFLRWLVAGVLVKQSKLDQIISKYAPDFPVEQIALIDRNLLRMALFELGSPESDTPPKVVINEAVELGKVFGSESTPRFVNGVLGAALNEVLWKL